MASASIHVGLSTQRGIGSDSVSTITVNSPTARMAIAAHDAEPVAEAGPAQLEHRCTPWSTTGRIAATKNTMLPMAFSQSYDSNRFSNAGALSLCATSP